MCKKDFVNKAKAIYGDRFDYKYVPDIILENYTNIPIYCPEHGLFYQTVYQHLKGVGCMVCNVEKEMKK